MAGVLSGNSQRHRRLCSAVAFAVFGAWGAAPCSFAADQVLTFRNGTNNWSNSNAWNPAGIPNNAAITYDAVFAGNNDTDLLRLDLNVTIQKFTFSRGFLQGTASQTLTLNDSFKWTGGIIGSSKLVATAGGTISAKLQCVINNAILENQGVMTYTSTYTPPPSQQPLRLDGTGAIINDSGATFDIAGDFNVGVTASTTHFDNLGLLIKSSGTGVAQIFTQFNDSGSVRVDSGTLQFVGGGSIHSGSDQAAAGARLFFNGNTTGFSSTAVLGGEGTLEFAAGELGFDGKLLGGAGPLRISLGQVHFNAASDLKALGLSTADGGRPFQLGRQGTTNFDTGHTVVIYNLFSDNGGSPTSNTSPVLTGSDNITLNGPATWTGGTIAGPIGAAPNTIAVNGGMTITSSGMGLLNRKLQNNSTITWTGGYIQAMSGAIIENTAGATFDIKTDTRIEWGPTHGAPLPFFTNAGLIVKSAGTGVTEIDDLRLLNTGTVRVESGTLTLFHSGGGPSPGALDTGVNSGTFDIAQGATMVLSEHTMDPSSTVRGAGTIEFGGNWNLIQGTYNISGSTHARGAAAFQAGANIINVGQFLNIDFNGSASFDTGKPVLLHDVNVGGTLAGSDPLAIDGKISGAGTITAANVTASGDLSPGNSPGNLTVKGKLTLTPSAKLTIEIGRTDFDLLTTSGGLTLDGNLVLHLLDSYRPTASDRFTIATSSTPIAGQFDDVVPGKRLAIVEGGSFAVNYGPSSAFGSGKIVLSDYRTPEPGTLMLLAFAAPVFLSRRRQRRTMALQKP